MDNTKPAPGSPHVDFNGMPCGKLGEAVVSLVLADSFLEKFSGDSLGEIARNYSAATERLQARFKSRR